MCEENSLIKFIEEIKDSYSKNNYSNYKELEIENNKTYKFLPIDNSNGFIVYSKGKINEIIEEENISLFEKFKNDYINCKDWEKIETAEETYTHRFYYYEELSKNKTNKNTAIIIMMNPAFAYSGKNDRTIKNIKEYLNNQNNKYGSFCIINLYPIRMPNSNILAEFIKHTKNEIEKNKEFIIEYLTLKKQCADNKIIAAWGANKEDNKIAYELFKKENIDFYCYGTTKEGFPRHFSPQSYWREGKFKEPKTYKIRRP